MTSVNLISYLPPPATVLFFVVLLAAWTVRLISDIYV